MIAAGQTCPAAAPSSPVLTARSWAALATGSLTLSSGSTQTVTSSGGSPAVAAKLNPAYQSNLCDPLPAAREPGTAPAERTVSHPTTLIGALTVTAHLAVVGNYPELVGRLWDVSAGGQTRQIIETGVVRPAVNQSASAGPTTAGATTVTFELAPNEYTLASGHTLELELVGSTAPWFRPSNGTFTLTVTGLHATIATHSPSRPPSPPVARPPPARVDGRPRPGSLARGPLVGQGTAMPAISAYDLTLPPLDTTGMERSELLTRVRPPGPSTGWPAPSSATLVTRLRDASPSCVTSRFHSALSMIARSPGLQRRAYGTGAGESILAMEGPATPACAGWSPRAFTPASADRLRPPCGGWSAGWSTAWPPRATASWWPTSASRTPSRSSASCSGHRPRTGSCSRAGPPTSSASSTTTWPRTCPSSSGPGRSSPPTSATMIAARRADPRDDLLSDLIAIEEEGDRLSTDEMAMLAEAVLMAGTDTTRNQLACSVALFTEHPDQWALLAERPELAPRAVEESMRYLGAVRGTARFASEDIVYRDVLFPRAPSWSRPWPGQPRPRGLRRPRRLRHHRGARHGPDDLRLGHPLLHGRGAGPGRAPRGAAAPGPPHARPRP